MQKKWGKICLTLFKKKTTFLDNKNQKIKRSKNWDFSKGVGPRFWSTISIFLYSFFIILRKIGQEKVLDDVLQRKKKPF